MSAYLIGCGWCNGLYQPMGQCKLFLLLEIHANKAV